MAQFSVEICSLTGSLLGENQHLVLFDPRRYASIMGRLATPSLVTQAIAPSISALLLEHGGSSLILGVLFAAALTDVLLVLFLVRFSVDHRRPAVSS